MLKRSIDDTFHNEITAWLVLAVSLFITAVGWYVSSEYVERRAADRFEFEVEDARQRILLRMLDYEQVLRGCLALFEASDYVSRDDWHNYVNTLEIDRFYPGIQGIGFSIMVMPQEKSSHEQLIRSEGFEEYAIRPEGERQRYSAIVYLEPFDWRNRRAFGYDMFSEPTRHSAMVLAADSGKPAISGKVTLVQETDEDIQAGILMYLPVYRKTAPLNSVEQRKEALVGYVYSPFRMNDLMEGILGTTPAGLRFELYDGGDGITTDRLLYESSHDATSWDSSFTSLSSLSLPNRDWTIHFYSLAGFEEAVSSTQPLIIAIGGIAADLLLFSIIFSLSMQKRRMHDKNLQLLKIDAERKTALKQLEQMAYFDPLTRLPNRRMISNNLTQSIVSSKRNHLFQALLFIDLDKFKQVNDNFGHETGDKLLVEVAARLTNAVREVDVVGRLAGDEFIVLIEGLSDSRDEAESKAEIVAEKVRASLAAPYILVGNHLECSASIGLVLFQGSEQGEDALLRIADQGMYEAKQQGGNQVYVDSSLSPVL